MDAYFDIFSGISGNMVLGALIDLGLEPETLKQELSRLKLDDLYKIKINKVMKEGIQATYVEVVLTGEDETHRNLDDINGIIDDSDLTQKIKDKSKALFHRLARVEAGIHGKDINDIHFHELGAVDTIVDIVGVIIGLQLMDIERIYASRINTGTGFVNCDHGRIPVPVPAVMELLQDIPVYSTGIKKELVTPTGAVIISSLAEGFGSRPEMQVKSTGYGAGKHELEIPNLLRINLGHFQQQSRDRVNIVETNIDDMNPEFYDYIMDKLFAAGALDVYLNPVQMKKNRPGVKISILAKEADLEEIADILMVESSTLGVRVIENVKRFCLERKTEFVSTPLGEIRVKIACKGKAIMNAAPEYDDCKRVARESDVPLKEVYRTALKAVENNKNLKIIQE